LAREKGVKFKLSEPVTKIVVDGKQAKKVITTKGEYEVDIVIGGADYHHIEDKLLSDDNRNYNEKHWDKQVMAPSSLLFYLGVNRKIDKLIHHNLFFDSDFEKHAVEIYDHPEWPSEPLFYANFTSLTNKDTAPEGCENGFFLIPIAPDLEDTEEVREIYFEKIMSRFELITKQSVRKNIIFKKSFCVKDFKSEYNSYKGNAYGMANTLLQTAVLRPKLKSKKVKNLYFTGQLTVPGPGVPPALISGKLVSQLIKKYQ
jgi:phytoene desaturase